MRVPKLALRYAKVLFDLGEPREIRLKQLNQLVISLENQPLFRKFMTSPQIGRKNKITFFQKIFKEDELFLHFFSNLLDKGRLDCLPEILIAYQQLIKNSADIMEAKLVTAISVEKSTLERLGKALENNYKMKVEIEEKIDPEMVGGAILIIDNHMIDFSIRDRLSKLKNDLLAIRI